MRRGEIRGQGGGRRDGTRGIHWAGVRLFLTPGFEPCQSLIEAGLDVDDAELAVFDFAMRSHGPEETDAMAGNGNVGVKAGGNGPRVPIAGEGDRLGVFRLAV